MCRDLRADEIDVRVQSQTDKGLILLLYKNARVDMDILDETFGKLNWQRTHEFKDGKLYCTVSVWDAEKQQWIAREDVGTESNTEAEKGQASDSFKRANVNFGIGRELYTSPFIWVGADKYTVNSKGKCNDTFAVNNIIIKNKVITGLEIKNEKSGEIVYTYGECKKPMSQNKAKNSSESERVEQQPTETKKEPKKAIESPKNDIDRALATIFEGRTLKEIYKNEPKFIQTAYELGDDTVKTAIQKIEAYIQESKK